jgi:hypothetical protein
MSSNNSHLFACACTRSFLRAISRQVISIACFQLLHDGVSVQRAAVYCWHPYVSPVLHHFPDRFTADELVTVMGVCPHTHGSALAVACPGCTLRLPLPCLPAVLDKRYPLLITTIFFQASKLSSVRDLRPVQTLMIMVGNRTIVPSVD